MALKCGKKRLLYSENEESVVHSWRATEWGENERDREKERKRVKSMCTAIYYCIYVHGYTHTHV